MYGVFFEVLVINLFVFKNGLLSGGKNVCFCKLMMVSFLLFVFIYVIFFFGVFLGKFVG